MSDPLNHPRELMRLFATPIYRDMVSPDKYFAIQDELKNVFDTLNSKDGFKQNPSWGSNTHMLSCKDGYDFHSDISEDFNLETFKEEIFNRTRHYLHLVDFPFAGGAKLIFTGCWMTLTKTGQYAHQHDHGYTDISGVYYYKTNSEDGAFRFFNPNKQISCSYAFSEYEHMWGFPPKQGTIMLFPGSLSHDVQENKTDNDRVSVSFNIQIVK